MLGFPIASNAIAAPAPTASTVPTPTSIVTSVTLTPAAVTLAGGAQQQFEWSVLGTNSPSQAVQLSSVGGTINATGLFVAPAAIGIEQVIDVTATSIQNPRESATSKVTVPALDTWVKATTVKVTVLASDQQGNSMAGALITATLNKVDIDDINGFVAPEEINVTADENGLAVLDLWPNSLGSQGSQYIIVIENPDTGSQLAVSAVVPAEDCFLHRIATLT